MSYNAKIKVHLVNADNGRLIDTGATLKYAVGSSSASPSTSINLDEWVAINANDESTIFNFGATLATNYSFVKFTADIRQWYRDGMLIMSTPMSDANPYGTLDIKNFIANADSAEHATSIEVYCYITCSKKKLHYDANGGTGAPEDQKFTAGSRFRLSTTEPSKTGSTFQGWNIAGTTTKYGSGAYITLQSDTTLYAMWTATDYQKDSYFDALVYKV